MIKKEKIKNLDYLISSFSDTDSNKLFPKHSLFIGAGCSISSQIPSGNDVCKLIQMICFARENMPELKRTLSYSGIEEFKIKINKLLETDKEIALKYHSYLENKMNHFIKQVDRKWMNLLKTLDDYKGKKLDRHQWENHKTFFYDSLNYGLWFDEFANSAIDRQSLVEDIISDKQPSAAYIIFANLMKHGLIKNVFTTNFDDLLNEALIRFCNIKARVFSHNEIARHINYNSQKPNIIKLHGDYLFENIKNTLAETASLERVLSEKFKNGLANGGLIVIGYSGYDYSIMQELWLAKKQNPNNPFHLIWCGMSSDNLSKRVCDLINKTRNSFFIKINGFDDIVCQLWASLKTPIEINNANDRKFDSSSEAQIKYLVKKSVSENNYTNDKIKFLQNECEKIEFYNILSLTLDPNDKIRILSKQILLTPLNNYYLLRGIAHFEKATKYNDFLELKLALSDLNTYLSNDSNNPRAYYFRACTNYKLKNFSDAVSDYSNCISLSPNDYLAYNNRGLAYLRLKDFEKSEEDFLTSLTINSNNADAFNNLGVNCRMSGRYEKGIDYVQQGIKCDENYSFLFGTLAELYAGLNNDKLVYHYMEKALRLGYPVKEFLYQVDTIQKYLNDTKFSELLQKYDDNWVR